METAKAPTTVSGHSPAHTSRWPPSGLTCTRAPCASHTHAHTCTPTDLSVRQMPTGVKTRSRISLRCFSCTPLHTAPAGRTHPGTSDMGEISEITSESSASLLSYMVCTDKVFNFIPGRNNFIISASYLGGPGCRDDTRTLPHRRKTLNISFLWSSSISMPLLTASLGLKVSERMNMKECINKSA